MENIEKKQLVPALVLRKEQEAIKELPLEVLDIPINQLLIMYKNRELPRRWSAE